MSFAFSPELKTDLWSFFSLAGACSMVWVQFVRFLHSWTTPSTSLQFCCVSGTGLPWEVQGCSEDRRYNKANGNEDRSESDPEQLCLFCPMTFKGRWREANQARRNIVKVSRIASVVGVSLLLQVVSEPSTKWQTSPGDSYKFKGTAHKKKSTITWLHTPKK